MFELKSTFALCDIGRLRNPKIKIFTFGQNYGADFIQDRIDLFFLSNVLQESIYKADVLSSFWSDNSPIPFALVIIKEGQKGNGLWKFNSSLLSDKKFVRNIKNHITTTIVFLNEENVFDDRIRWEYSNYKIRKLFIHFSAWEAEKRNKKWIL